jgi:hypothetical protein
MWNPVEKVKMWLIKKAIGKIIGEERMAKIIDFFFGAGRKTYWIALIGAVIGILQGYGVHIPAWILSILASLGLAALRNGVDNAAADNSGK